MTHALAARNRCPRRLSVVRQASTPSHRDRRKPSSFGDLPGVGESLGAKNDRAARLFSIVSAAVNAVHLAQLRRGLDHEHHPHVVPGGN